MENDVKMMAITKFGMGNPLVIIRPEQEFFAKKEDVSMLVLNRYAYVVKETPIDEPLKETKVEKETKTTTKPVSKAKSKATTKSKSK